MTRIGVAQFSGSVDLEENIDAVRRLARRAAELGVAVLGFHELANTVYVPFAMDRGLFTLAEPEEGPSVTAARAIAQETELVLVYPFFEREGDLYFNSAVVLGPDGVSLGKYRKTSIPTGRLLPAVNERYFFEPGDLGFPVVTTSFGLRVGVIICYDRNLPEPARCVALNGADVLFVPVTATALVRPWWELLLRARAIENLMFIAAPSRVGIDRGGAPEVSYIGESLIVDPAGQVIAHASPSEEDLVTAEIDPRFLQDQRARFWFLDDRRPELYGPITAPRRPDAPLPSADAGSEERGRIREASQAEGQQQPQLPHPEARQTGGLASGKPGGNAR